MKFYLPTMVFQERDAVRNHSEQMAHYGKKALIVTGKSSSKKNGALQDVTDGLKKYNTSYVIFDKIEENPSVESIMEAAGFGRAGRTEGFKAPSSCCSAYDLRNRFRGDALCGSDQR